MRCETCGAPAVILDNACVFCRTPVSESHAPAELLDYLGPRLAGADVKRFGFRRRGPVRELSVTVGVTTFTARVVRGRLQLSPTLAPAAWVDRLLTALSQEATGDAALRARLSRAGWKLRSDRGGQNREP